MNKVKLIIVCCFVSSIFALLNTAVAAEFNEEVYLAQVELDVLGYVPGSADGLWTEKTKAVIIKFQKDNNLQTNGQLDEATKNLLKTKIVTKFKVAPKNIVDKIPTVLNYEGSDVAIVYNPSGDAIYILNVGGNWRIIMSEVGDNIKLGKVRIIGKAGAGKGGVMLMSETCLE